MLFSLPIDTFLSDDFCIASVSYRREGGIYLDAVEDVMEMRDHLCNNCNIDGLMIVQGKFCNGLVQLHKFIHITFFLNSA
jgi:hypothetical protein